MPKSSPTWCLALLLCDSNFSIKTDQSHFPYTFLGAKVITQSNNPPPSLVLKQIKTKNTTGLESEFSSNKKFTPYCQQCFIYTYKKKTRWYQKDNLQTKNSNIALSILCLNITHLQSFKS